MSEMRALHKILWIAGVEYRRFFTLKKILVMLFSFIFLAEYIIGRMADISGQTGMQLNYLEPMALVMSYSFYAMVIPLTYTVLMSDFPDKSSGGIFIMIRTKRRSWLFGELLYAEMVGVTYLVFLLVASMVCVRDAGMFSLSWSPYTVQLYQEFPEIYAASAELFLEAGTVCQGTPASVFTVSSALMLLYFLTIAQVLCLFKLLKLKRVGLFVNIGIAILGAVAVSYIQKIKWLFPLAHAIFGIHYREFYAQPECRILVSVLYFAVLNGGLAVANCHLAGKCHIGDDDA
jgi:hypothetical protein